MKRHHKIFFFDFCSLMIRSESTDKEGGTKSSSHRTVSFRYLAEIIWFIREDCFIEKDWLPCISCEDFSLDYFLYERICSEHLADF